MSCQKQHRMCSTEKVFLKIAQTSQENTFFTEHIRATASEQSIFSIEKNVFFLSCQGTRIFSTRIWNVGYEYSFRLVKNPIKNQIFHSIKSQGSKLAPSQQKFQSQKWKFQKKARNIFIVNNKDTRTTSMTSIKVFFSIVYFEHLFICWDCNISLDFIFAAMAIGLSHYCQYLWSYQAVFSILNISLRSKVSGIPFS